MHEPLSDESDWEEELPLNQEQLADEFAGLGRTLLKQGLVDDAIDAFELVLSKHPEDAAALCNLGIACLRQERWDDAEKFTRRYLGLAAKDVAATVRLGIMVRHRGEFKEAIQLLRQAIKMDRASALAWRELGSTLLENGEPGEAVNAFKKSIDLKPQSGTSWAGLGKAYERLHEPNKAQESYHEGLRRLEPGRRGPVYARLGRFYRKMGEWSQAETALNKAIAKGVSDPEVELELGYVYFMQDKREMALQQAEVLKGLGAIEMSSRLRHKVMRRKTKHHHAPSLAVPSTSGEGSPLDGLIKKKTESLEGLNLPLPNNDTQGDASTTGGSTMGGFLKWLGIGRTTDDSSSSSISLPKPSKTDAKAAKKKK